MITSLSLFFNKVSVSVSKAKINKITENLRNCGQNVGQIEDFRQVKIPKALYIRRFGISDLAEPVGFELKT